MNKKTSKKLALSKESVRQLTASDLGKAQGGYYTEADGCVETVPRSFCVCPTKNMCTINC